VQKRLNIDLHPAKSLYVVLHGEGLDVASTKDSGYSSSGGVLLHPPFRGFARNTAELEVEGALQYPCTRILVLWELGVGHCWPGALMSANNHGAQLTLAYFPLTYRLKVGSGTAGRVIEHMRALEEDRGIQGGNKIHVLS